MNIFKQLIKSIYSPSDIATFINQRKRKSILFIFILALITLLPSTFTIGQTIIQSKNEIIDVINNEMPDFTIKNNQLVSTEQAPIIYNGDQLTYIFDSTNSLTATDITDSSTVAFLSNGIYITGEFFSYDLIGIQSKSDLNILFEPITNSNTLIYTVLTAIYVSSAIVLFLVLNIEVALISLIGVLLSRKTYKFAQMYTIVPYTMTLTTVFFFIMDSLKIIVPFASFTALFVTLIVLYLTIIELRKTDDKQSLV